MQNRVSSASSGLRFRAAVAVPAVGRSSSSPSCTLGATSWCLISAVGDANECRPCPRRRGSNWLPTPIYAREQVAWAWLGDPVLKTLEVMKLAADVWTVHHVFGGDEKVAALPFDAIEIDLRSIWGDAA